MQKDIFWTKGGIVHTTPCLRKETLTDEQLKSRLAELDKNILDFMVRRKLKTRK